ncbi:MAG: PH domain-containing protein, partial [Ancrocorticia sp.]
MNQWHRLSSRIIWVDLAISILSILPAVLAIWLFDVDSSQGQIWPLIGLAVFGVAGAYFDALRWAFTRFRITPSHVELKTGIVFRQHRSIKRDRIRSVDVETKLRHRVARMRVVTIGAGQQAAAGESALALDALSAEDAQELQHALLDEANDEVELGGQNGQLSHGDEPLRVFARFEPSWVIYNIFNIWAYVFALGLGWGAI